MPDQGGLRFELPLPSTRDELVEEQREIAHRQPTPWHAGGDAVKVAGGFVAFERGIEGSGTSADKLWAAVAVMLRRRLIDSAVIIGRARSAYEAGLLFLREGAPLIEAFSKLSVGPDVAVVNGTGRDHPRRCGITVHVGALLDIPTVGVTHRPLLAEGSWPEDRRGASSPLWLRETLVGYWLRVRPRTRPVAVHAGWRTDPDTALHLVRAVVYRARTPEPIRMARQLARRQRSRDE